MSALTGQSMFLVRKTLTPEQVEKRRLDAEKILGRQLPPRSSRPAER